MKMELLDLSNELKIIRKKISEIGGYHITKDNRTNKVIVQCFYKDFDKYVKQNKIPTKPITIFRDLQIQQSFEVGEVIYCRD